MGTTVDFALIMTTTSYTQRTVRDPLVGRAGELAKLTEFVNGDVRVTTLVGPPGVGKTRVAREWEASWVRTRGMASLIYCDLNGVEDARAGAARLAQALSVTEKRIVDRESLIAAIAKIFAERKAVLLLDNVDHVISGGRSFMEELLARTPTIQIVMTSREPSRLAGEALVVLEPLDTESAAELFIARSAGRIPARRTPRKTRLLVTEIVELLDGLPLAIELAANRLSVLSPAQLAERLRHETLEVTGNAQDKTNRHASLSRTIQWSWDVLTDVQRDALAQLSVFRRTFTIADAEAVVSLADDSVLDVVSALAARSLVQSDSLGELRLLAPIRDFAQSQRRGLEAADDIEDRFANHLVDRAEILADAYATGHGREALLELESQAADLIAAHRSVQDREPDLAIRAALALIQPMRSAGGGDEYRELFGNAKKLVSDTTAPKLAARIHFACGLVELHGGDLSDAARDFARSARLAAEAGDLGTEADALVGSGALAIATDEELAKRHWDDALGKYRQADDRLGVGNTSANLAVLALEQGDLDLGNELASAALDAFEAAGLSHRLAFPLLVRAALASEDGSLDSAERDARRSLEIAREIHHRGHEVEALSQLALIEWSRSNVAEAVRLQSETRAAATEDVLAATCLVLAVMRGLLGERTAADDLLREAQAAMAAFRGRNGLELYRTCRNLVTGEGKRLPESSFLARAVCRLAAQYDEPNKAGDILVVGPDAKWFQVGDRPQVSLGRRMILRRLVSALATHRIEKAGTALTAVDLQDLLWPGQDIMPDTAANRVYVSVSKLRAMGLRRHLITDGDGYLFDSALEVSVSHDHNL